MPALGSIVLYVILVMAAVTFGVAVAAGSRPLLLKPARLFAYTTVCLVALDVAILAYAFQTHDFSVRYVERYSDRSMEWYYLLTSLWGGQDGSLLWWTFILAIYTGACVRWLRGRYQGLQPYIIATIMVVMLFFVVVMAFAANPFETTWSGVPPDGKGLNPLLQNFYMIFHPPSLYVGFVGCTIPFAFAIAALVSGRLHEEWLWACRKWLLFAWLFLSLGNILGALWAYEELGWGGYWAWDPVENASFMPWLVATAFVHSVMIQERRGMLKVWNLFLPIVTFGMTIFGTFLTRSGLISSVHSFAQSGIGTFFVWFLAGSMILSAVLVLVRLPRLFSEHHLESIASREAIFLFNNWILLAGMVVVTVLTVFPLLSEAFTGEKVTVGPNFFTFFMIPIALLTIVLMGIGTVVPWRKSNAAGLVRSLAWPIATGLVAGAALVAFGRRIGFPPYVEILPDVIETIRASWLRWLLRGLYGVFPVTATVLLAFSTAVIAQEYWRGTALRMRSTKESAPVAFFRLIAKAKRRYGGYVVHTGFILMIFGMVGSAYKVEKEAALRPGQSMSIWDYTATFRGLESEVDAGKRMIFALIEVERDGKPIGTLKPGKFVYRTHPDMPTSEVAIRSSVRDDHYVILGSADTASEIASIKIVVNPLTPWIWIGALVLLAGTIICLWPDGARVPRGAARAGGTLALALLLVLPAGAWAQDRPSAGTRPMTVGSVEMRDKNERILFGQLLCPCGDCARLPLTTCTCGTADDLRVRIRERVAGGESGAQILAWYEEEYGPEHLSTPPSRGFLKLAWIAPPVAVVVGAVGVWFLVRRWRRPGPPTMPPPSAPTGGAKTEAEAAYERKLEEELRND